MDNTNSSFFNKFVQLESAGGILLVGAALIAILLANTPLFSFYTAFTEIPVAIKVGALEIDKPLLLWVNDGLMAIFFLMVGLELKREILEGELSNKKDIILPGLGALGGMAIPAAIYVFVNANDPVALQGWAIPAATDIAFALAVLSLLGPRVPISLKIFLTSVAIFDDIGAILIIALFYTSKISLTALVVAAVCIGILFFLNKRGVIEKSPYLFVGGVMWIAMLKSGVHATLAGVVLAMFIPMGDSKGSGVSPLKSLEQDLHTAVSFLILPIFAFFNSGINFSGMGMEQILHGVPLGIALGLFFGKQIGVFGFCWLGIVLKFAELPRGMSLLSLYGAALLCGIGFTMSLFIGSLAFEETGVNLLVDERLGIIMGSLASGVLGYFILKSSLASDE